MKILRYYWGGLTHGWSLGLAQPVLLLFAPILILNFALWLPFPVNPRSFGDAIMALWFLVAMIGMVFLSASRATRMRQLLERLSLERRGLVPWVGLVTVTLGCVLIVAEFAGLVRQALDETQRSYGQTTLAKTWSYQWMRTLLGVWLLLLGYRFKLVWDALAIQLDPREKAANIEPKPSGP